MQTWNDRIEECFHPEPPPGLKPFYNPFLAAHRELLAQEAILRQSRQWLPAARRLVRAFSWAVPTPEAIRVLVECGPVLEVGAGNGYWAWCVQQAGGDIVPTDSHPGKSNIWVENHAWTAVHRMTALDAVKEHDHATLFACWAPPDRGEYTYFREAAKAFRGKRIILVGERASEPAGAECTGAFDTQRWRLVSSLTLPSLPFGAYDNELAVWERKRSRTKTVIALPR